MHPVITVEVGTFIRITPSCVIYQSLFVCMTLSVHIRTLFYYYRYINVDIYGRCGKLTCRKSDEKRCGEMLDTDYKFYLSFENSLCKDYVTEKFFKV